MAKLFSSLKLCHINEYTYNFTSILSVLGVLDTVALPVDGEKVFVPEMKKDINSKKCMKRVGFFNIEWIIRKFCGSFSLLVS